MNTNSIDNGFLVGDVAIVFDNVAWRGRDVGDNSQFWKTATITAIYDVEPYLYPPGVRMKRERLADVTFHHNGRHSKGHFLDGIKRPGVID
jgi:hypothetical protein